MLFYKKNGVVTVVICTSWLCNSNYLPLAAIGLDTNICCFGCFLMTHDIIIDDTVMIVIRSAPIGVTTESTKPSLLLLLSIGCVVLVSLGKSIEIKNNAYT